MKSFAAALSFGDSISMASQSTLLDSTAYLHYLESLEVMRHQADILRRPLTRPSWPI